MNHTTMGEGEQSMQALLAKKNELGKKLLAVLVAVVLAVGVALPTGALSGAGEAWATISDGSSGDYVYWRFHGAKDTYDVEKSGSTELTELAKHVHVTATGENTDGTDNGAATYVIPYGTVSEDASTVALLPTDAEPVDQDAVGKYIYIETDEGYVVTSYMIGCEFSSSMRSQYAEGCNTAATSSLQVVLSEDGKYKSSITVAEDTYKGESGTTDGYWGHGSEEKGGSSHHYALLLTLAQVNVDMTVDKVANRESISQYVTNSDGSIDYSNSTIVYTATADIVDKNANAVDYLVYPTFEDAMFSGSAINSVKLVNKADGSLTTLKNESFSVKTKTDGSYLSASEYSAPARWYKDGNYLYVDGCWQEGYSLVVEYTYIYTGSFTAETEVTNTVWLRAGKPSTATTLVSSAVASVDVIINNPGKASLRIYKTFEGLSYDEIYGTLAADGTRSGGILEGFYIIAKATAADGTVTNYKLMLDPTGTTDSSGNVLVGLDYSIDGSDPDSNEYAFYGSLLNVDPGTTFEVTEYGYTHSGYNSTSVETAWKLGEAGEVKAGTSSIISDVALAAGTTTFVSFNNAYSNAVDVELKKQVTGNMGDRSEHFEFTVASAGLAGKTIVATYADGCCSDATYHPASSVNLVFDESGNCSTKLSLAHDEKVTLAGVPLGTSISVTEANAGYDVAASCVTKSDSTPKAIELVTATDSASAVVSAAASVEAVDGLVITFTNTKDVLVDTGVSLDSVPFIVLLAGGLLGCLALAMRAAMKRKED